VFRNYSKIRQRIAAAQTAQEPGTGAEKRRGTPVFRNYSKIRRRIAAVARTAQPLVTNAQ
jgi:hypothetical protein